MQLGLPFAGEQATHATPGVAPSESAASLGAVSQGAAPDGRASGDVASKTFADLAASERPLHTEAGDTLVFVRHRRARRYVLRVRADGRVRVTIPRGGTQREARSFADRHREWIAGQRARLARATWAASAVASYRLKARTDLPPRLHELAHLHGLRVARISIRDQRTRWGSCGHDGHISINWRLVLMPDWVRDYVLIHELMHMRRMDHSPEFWRHVAGACPQFREARAWLRANGAALR